MTTPQINKLADYKPTPFSVASLHLEVNVEDKQTQVISTAHYQRRPGETGELTLHGSHQTLLGIEVDGESWDTSRYEANGDTLTILGVPDDCHVRIKSVHDPEKNHSCMGFYKSASNYFTQCEAEGFRRITYFYDRPDVMTVYTTRIEADRERFPVLLANGNLIEQGEVGAQRHFAIFLDPFPKPSYLFAMVVADLEILQDTFTTKSGKQVSLAIYAEKADIDKCHHGMQSLKKSMKWDEEVYGLECDLDHYKIVAVEDFNFGAMENKGLNIFNTSCVLASPRTTSDQSFDRIEGVIAHEYFHNWTGNRVTCRDWFQLCLKEGLTVFRDQEFSSDLHSRSLMRIYMVQGLRASQFREDAGPLSHPVRPDHYIEIDNFYTATVYEKGAEVVRMLHTLLGAEAFHKGMRLYFDRHDGQAITVEDFVKALGDASQIDLTEMMKWYTQPGTPHVKFSGHYDAAKKIYKLTAEQTYPVRDDHPEKTPVWIPIRVAMIGQSTAELVSRNEGERAHEHLVVLKDKVAEFVFEDVEEEPVPSVLRGFSAPVKWDATWGRDARIRLMRNDSDGFGRWDNAQQLLLETLVSGVDSAVAGREVVPDGDIVDALGEILADTGLDSSVAAETLRIPAPGLIAQELDVVDPEAVFQSRYALRKVVATKFEDLLWSRYEQLSGSDPLSLAPKDTSARALAGVCLGYLEVLRSDRLREVALGLFRARRNMTEVISSVALVRSWLCPERDIIFDEFYQEYKAESLVVDDWFAMQATADLADILSRVRRLVKHPDFAMRNPNRFSALVGSFCHHNSRRFHAKDGEGYLFCREMILAMDKINPASSSYLASAFSQWKRYDESRKTLMTDQLNMVAATEGISKGLYEVVTRTLSAP